MRPLPSRSLFAALIVVAAALSSGCSATHISSTVGFNPLPRVAERAAADWSVEWVDENTLHISDWWPLHSLLTVGYTAFHAELRYSYGRLDSTFYLESVNLLSLFIPYTLDTDEGLVGAALTPYMRIQMNQVLDWANVAKRDRAARHGPK